MLYTTYLSRVKYLPKDMFKVLVTRFPSQWLKIDYKNKDIGKVLDFENMYLNKRLSPSTTTLLNYKNDKDWDKYCLEFNKEMKNENFIKDFSKLIEYIKSDDKDVAIICMEKDYLHCHRYLEAQEAVKNGIEWKEFELEK